MMTKPGKRVRCAVYTRVSTEYGLDQEFNSTKAHLAVEHQAHLAEAVDIEVLADHLSKKMRPVTGWSSTWVSGNSASRMERR
jgi:hypothetical protein